MLAHRPSPPPPPRPLSWSRQTITASSHGHRSRARKHMRARTLEAAHLADDTRDALHHRQPRTASRRLKPSEEPRATPRTVPACRPRSRCACTPYLRASARGGLSDACPASTIACASPRRPPRVACIAPADGHALLTRAACARTHPRLYRLREAIGYGLMWGLVCCEVVRRSGPAEVCSCAGVCRAGVHEAIGEVHAGFWTCRSAAFADLLWSHNSIGDLLRRPSSGFKRCLKP